MAVTLLSIVADLGSKWLAFRSVAPAPVTVNLIDVRRVSDLDPRMVNSLIPPHPPMVVLPGVLNLTLVLNPGAVFGIGPGQQWFFIAFTVVALTFGLLMFAKWTKPRDHFAHAAIGLLIGGGIGNLYDRLFYGCVRDFLHPLPDAKWPFTLDLLGFGFKSGSAIWPYVSNVADALLLLGIGMLLIHLWRRDRAAPSSSPSRTPV